MVFFITSLQFKSLFVSSSILHIDQFAERDFSRGVSISHSVVASIHYSSSPAAKLPNAKHGN